METQKQEGFFAAQRRAHPIRLGDTIEGKRVIETFYRSSSHDVWGTPYAITVDRQIYKWTPQGWEKGKR